MKVSRWCGPVCVLFVAAALSGCGLRARSLRNKGIAEFQIGRAHEARKLLKRSLDFNAENAEALYYMGRAMHDDGFYDQAIYYYQSCLLARPGHNAAQEWLGKAMTSAAASAGNVRPVPATQPSGAPKAD